MRLHKRYITVLATALISCLHYQLVAQTAIRQDTPLSWIANPTDFENEIHQAILALKMAEATVTDSATAAQLETLGYLAIAQSGFNAQKSLINNQSGYWMLPYPIAIKYGLVINSIIDERKELEKSTKAAYKYWNYLYNLYNNDCLADLAFVQSPIAISKYAKDSINYPNGYAQLVKTQQKIEKIKRIYQGTTIIPVGPVAPTVFVKSSQVISFIAIHHFIQIPTFELSALNPQWVSTLYNPAFGKLKLPLKYQAAFKQEVAAMEQKTRDDYMVWMAANTKRINLLKGDIPDLKTYKPIRYKVKMGDNLGRIAQRYHVKISNIRSWNELKSDRIYAGQRLTIYVSINQKVVVAKASPKKGKKSPLKVGEYWEYTVKTGDTLWGISQLFKNVDADIIMEDNGIGVDITPGQVLKIRKVL